MNLDFNLDKLEERLHILLEAIDKETNIQIRKKYYQDLDKALTLVNALIRGDYHENKK